MSRLADTAAAGAAPASAARVPGNGTIAAARRLGAAALVAAALLLGWNVRDAHLLTAEHGLGYALGIAGGGAMLLLMVYPLRKRFRALFALGPVRHWFRLHMALGVIGPLLILYHANFSLGSLNSNIALASMLLVATSGLIGRFLYTRIHMGLYGRRATFERMRLDSEITRNRLATLLAASPDSEARLRRYEEMALAPARGLGASIARAATLAVRTRWEALQLSRQMGPALRRIAETERWSAGERRARLRTVRRHVADYLSLTRRIAELTFYERLFSWWHVLHLPLFVLLLVTALAHVWAVHAY